MTLEEHLQQDFAQLDLEAKKLDVQLAIYNLIIVDRTRRMYLKALRKGQSLDFLKQHFGLQQPSTNSKKVVNQTIIEVLKDNSGEEFTTHQLWIAVQNKGLKIKREQFFERISRLWTDGDCVNVGRRQDPSSTSVRYLYFWVAKTERSKSRRKPTEEVKARRQKIFEALQAGPSTVAGLSELTGEPRKTVRWDLSEMARTDAIEPFCQPGVNGYVWRVREGKP